MRARRTKRKESDIRRHQPAEKIATPFSPLPISVPTASRCACGGGCPTCQARTMGMKVSSPEDAQERQATQVARQVGGQTANTTPARDKDEVVTSSAASGASPVPKSSGQPLDPATRSFMEPRLGFDLSPVLLHTDAAAALSAQSLGAHAYTVGTHIVFGKNQYKPGTASGNQLLAHELVHAIQQTHGSGARDPGGRTNLLQADSIIQRDYALEPPHPEAAPAVALTPAQMVDAIAANERMLGAAGVDAIREIRDVLGVSPEPAVVDEEFVNAVLQWQAEQGLPEDGRLGPRSARPLFREIGAEGGSCRVKSGPTYTPGGTFAAVPAGGRDDAHFRMAAEFESDLSAMIFPSCCEVRQFIRWNAAAAASFTGGTVPHAGFPAAHPSDSWIEDRNGADTLRYGRRVGLSGGVAGNRYLDATGATNQAFGHIFQGEDFPGGPAALAGQWRFLLKVVDVCNGGTTVGTQDVIRINW